MAYTSPKINTPFSLRTGAQENAGVCQTVGSYAPPK